MRVKDIMTRQIISLKKMNTLGEALELCIKYKIDSVPILDDDGSIYSLVTKTDFMKSYMNNDPLSKCIMELPKKNVITINEYENIVSAWGQKVGRLPVVNNEGNLIGMLTRTDITSNLVNKITKEIIELKKNTMTNQELEAVIESSYDGIYITDGEGNTLRINKSYERITGLNREKMIGRNMTDLVKEGFISQSGTLMVLKSGTTNTLQQEFSTGKKIMITSTPVFNDNNEIILVVTNVREITQLYELEEQLQKNKELNNKYFTEIEEMRMQLLGVSDLIAEDNNMLETISIAKRIAKVDTTALLLGETGVGKEEIAKFIHKNSFRFNKPFIKVNCGAIPPTLIESQLFGYARGAFTGANKEGKIGLFELASSGTIFLDEVGELPLDMQVKLLQVLQEREIEKVGGVKPIKIDVRVIAATNRDIVDMVKNKLFREDLYYRLNVVPIYIPPLRERKGDILPLTKHFLDELNIKYNFNKSFSSETLDFLYEYSWPGNVRQLKNIVERVVVMSTSDRIIRSDLPRVITGNLVESQVDIGIESRQLKEVVEGVELQMMNKAFEKHGNVRGAAKELGIDASTFVRKRKRYMDKTSKSK